VLKNAWLEIRDVKNGAKQILNFKTEPKKKLKIDQTKTVKRTTLIVV